MKRLLCLVSSMNSGGAETFLMKLYRVIDRSKYQMDFCVNIYEKGFYDDEIESLGGRIYHIPPKSSDVTEYRKQLTQVVKEGQYRSVLRITSNAAGFMDLMLAKRAGAIRCCARSSNSSDGDNFTAWLAHRLGRFLYDRYVDVKIAPSDLAARYTFGKKAYDRGDVSILHNAVDLSVFQYNTEDRQKIRKEFQIAQNSLIVGHIGRFDVQKNHKYLLDVFAQIIKRRSDAVLLLVGRGPLEDEIQAIVGKMGLMDRVVFAGIRNDVSKLLSAMDVLVFPSLYEGMPNAVIEAQATGLPCVISDTITREADITGLVKYHSISEGADAWARATLSEAGIARNEQTERFVSAKYDIQSIADEFIKLTIGE